jgi:hypothetical protein
MYIDEVYKKEPLIFIPVGRNMLKYLVPFVRQLDTNSAGEWTCFNLLSMCSVSTFYFVLFCEGRNNYTILF